MFEFLRRRGVFKRITIELTAPICGCDEQDFSWTTPQGTDGPTLQIACKKCKTTLTVGNSEFKAAFSLDTPYPKGRAEKKEAKILQLVIPPKE